jgi:hypothetical protein
MLSAVKCLLFAGLLTVNLPACSTVANGRSCVPSPAGPLQAQCRQVFVNLIQETLGLWLEGKWDDALTRIADGRGPGRYTIFTHGPGRQKVLQELAANGSVKRQIDYAHEIQPNFQRIQFGVPELMPTLVTVSVEGLAGSRQGKLFSMPTSGLEELFDEARNGGRADPGQHQHDKPVPTQFVDVEGVLYWMPWGW